MLKKRKYLLNIGDGSKNYIKVVAILGMFWYLNEVDGIRSAAKNGSSCKSPNEMDN